MSVESTKRIGNLDFEITVSGHQLIADVPAKLGGLNAGPSPHDYLQAALATCTAITMQRYANRKGIPLTSSDITVRIVREGPTNQLLREIKLFGELTEEQRNSLFAIAEKCPIQRFLERGAKIESHLLRVRPPAEPGLWL